MGLFERYFSRVFDRAKAHRRALSIFAAACVIVSAVGVFGIRFDNDIATLLPTEESLQNILRFFREAHFSDKVVLDVGLVDDVPDDILHAAVDTIAARLTDRAFVRSVRATVDVPQALEQIPQFFSYLPALFTDEQLRRVDKKLTPEGTVAALEAIYRQAMLPTAGPMMQLARYDPYAIASVYWPRLESLASAYGYDVVIRRNHLTSRDGKHALIVIETPVRLTDGFGSRKLLAYLKEVTSGLPVGIAVTMIAGHRHTVSNEAVVKHDIARTSTVAAIAFLLIFLLTYRDPRAIIFFLIPACAVLIAMNVCALIFGRLSVFVAGMGAVIVGIADDYGIHVYTAVRLRNDRGAVKDIAAPLFVAALVTMSVFGAFFFSRVPGYRELALFAIISIALCLLFVLFLFPHMINTSAARSMPVHGVGQFRWPVSDKTIVVAWILCLAVCGILASRARFSNDVSRFDGTEQSVIAAEENFESVWSRNGRPAFLVTSGVDLESALAKNEAVYAAARKAIGEENITGIAWVLPSLKTRRDNINRWIHFWSEDKRRVVTGLITGAVVAYDFSYSAFTPFLDNIARPPEAIAEEPPELIRQMCERFIVSSPGAFLVFSSFPDRQKLNEKLQASGVATMPGVFIASRFSLGEAMSKAVAGEVKVMAIVALIAVLALTLLLIRNIMLSLIALSCVASAFLVMAAAFVIKGTAISVPAVIASLVVGGLCIDYGFFTLNGLRREQEQETAKAVWVSVMTTLAGVVALLTAKHPILFTIGFTLTVGMCTGYVVSQVVVPALYRVIMAKR